MKPHPHSHRFASRRLPPELFEPTGRRPLRRDKPFEDVLAEEEIDEAIEQLYGGRRRVCVLCGSVARRRRP
jgi:hypothetical protein